MPVITITPQILEKISATCSGHAMMVNITNATATEVSAAMLSVKHRTLDASDPAVFDDKMATIVVGVDKLSSTEYYRFIFEMDKLRFRNILIFPTKTWRESTEANPIPFWDRMGTIMECKTRSRLGEMLLVEEQ